MDRDLAALRWRGERREGDGGREGWGMVATPVPQLEEGMDVGMEQG